MKIRTKIVPIVCLAILLPVAGSSADAAGGAASRASPPPATAPNPASAACVEFRNNEKGIKDLARSKGMVTGDVVLFNRCATDIAIVTHARDTYRQTGDVPPAIENQCAAEVLAPNRSRVLRSQSKEKRAGLDPWVPKYPPVICLGPAQGGEACGCASGVVQVPMPDGSASR